MTREEAIRYIRTVFTKDLADKIILALEDAPSVYPKSDKSAFTLEELELLDQCLSKHFYSISGMPNTVVSCAEKIQKLKERME